ncbi:hypothetical protein MMC13_008034 [Lambiella insularis]|nr:hypothetical protein [Lambiella insularis]
MFCERLDLTTALRPELLPDEILIFVQDAVGLYEGKFKIPSYQNGHVYLTSHRICYVDNAEPRRNSTAVELKNVDTYEFYGGFLKSSAKITLYPRPSKRSSTQFRSGSSTPGFTPPTYAPSRSPTATPFTRNASPHRVASPGSSASRQQNVTWICPICSFSNPLPSNFDPTTASVHTLLPPCLACGITPPLTHILKASIASTSRRESAIAIASVPTQPLLESHRQYGPEAVSDYSQSEGSEMTGRALQSLFQCPRCTFQNHPSLLSCELCGASLISSEDNDRSRYQGEINRSESPGPSLDSGDTLMQFDTPDYIKISFRAGGEKIFYERLKGAMTQRRWLLQNAPSTPQAFRSDSGNTSATEGSGRDTPNSRSKGVGIAGLERRGLELRKNNERVIGDAFEDLEALMASAKEIIALAENFASNNPSADANALIRESAAALGMVTTRSMLGPNTGSDTLYVSELSRNLAEYLTDDRQGILKKEGGIMSLVDLWAVFNQASNGVELTYPAEFEKAARMWEKLGLPVRLREFRNGLLVVQRHDWTDDKSVAQLLAWLQELRLKPPAGACEWDWVRFGTGVTAQEAASRFGWSVGVATEELEMAEDKGALCREESIEGVRFWENWLGAGSVPNNGQRAVEAIGEALQSLGL